MSQPSIATSPTPAPLPRVDLFAAQPAPPRQAPAEPLEEVLIADIDRTAATQVREGGLQEVTVVRYREALQGGAVFPPIRLRRTPERRLILGDGFHRLEARMREGETVVRAIVLPGTVTDAILDGAKGNRDHGLPMSGSDKANAVRLLLQSQEFTGGKVSQETIAKAVGLSSSRVSQLVAELDAKGLIVKPTTRTGRDGRTIHTAKIGARPPDGDARVEAAKVRLVKGPQTRLELAQAAGFMDGEDRTFQAAHRSLKSEGHFSLNGEKKWDLDLPALGDEDEAANDITVAAEGFADLLRSFMILPAAKRRQVGPACRTLLETTASKGRLAKTAQALREIADALESGG